MSKHPPQTHSTVCTSRAYSCSRDSWLTYKGLSQLFFRCTGLRADTSAVSANKFLSKTEMKMCFSLNFKLTRYSCSSLEWARVAILFGLTWEDMVGWSHASSCPGTCVVCKDEWNWQVIQVLITQGKTKEWCQKTDSASSTNAKHIRIAAPRNLSSNQKGW